MQPPPATARPAVFPLLHPLVSSSGATLACKRDVAELLSQQMTRAIRFDLICERMVAIAGELVDAECDVEVVEFAPRAMLGPLLLRAWKEREELRRQQLQGGGQFRVTQFIG
jgi:hypothetical protein